MRSAREIAASHGFLPCSTLCGWRGAPCTHCDAAIAAILTAQREAIEAAAKVCDQKAWDEAATFGFGANTAAGLGAKDCASLIRALGAKGEG